MRSDAAAAAPEGAPPSLVERDGRLVIVIPMRFKRRNGRKEIILPPSPEGVFRCDARRPPRPASAADNPAVQKQLVIAVARAHRWQRLLDEGRFKSVRDLAAALDLDIGYVRRTLGLTLLRPDLVRAILDGTEANGLSLNRLVVGVPAKWEEQDGDSRVPLKRTTGC
jgi:hypothetical protein